MTGHLHINWTRYSEEKRVIRYCPVCERRRRMVAKFQEWYGWTVTCCGCGDMWTGGEMHPRPFMPRWRAESTAKAKADWTRIGSRP